MPKEKPMLNASTFFSSLAKCQRKSRCSTHRLFYSLAKCQRKSRCSTHRPFFDSLAKCQRKSRCSTHRLSLILWQNAKGKADAQRIDFPIGKIKILLLREKLIKWVDRLICGHSTGNRHNCRHSLRRNRRSFCAYACGRAR